jgi:p-hydroxybenzoate 3-monooxygenase
MIPRQAESRRTRLRHPPLAASLPVAISGLESPVIGGRRPAATPSPDPAATHARRPAATARPGRNARPAGGPSTSGPAPAPASPPIDVQGPVVPHHRRPGVVIIGAGVAGLVAGVVLQREGIDTLVLERCSRAEIESRPRAGLLGPGPVAVLERHGLADGLQAKGSPHGSCEFRHRRRGFVVEYAQFAEGRRHTVYPQQRLVSDLLAAYLAAGGTVEFNATDITLTKLMDDEPSAEFTAADGTRHQVRGRYLAGCDGHHGISRASIPAGVLRCTEQAPSRWAWLAVLAAVAPSTDKIIYAVSPRGYAGHMLRDAQTSRFYLQVPSGADPADWPAERIWEELHARLAVDDEWTLAEGPLLEPPSVVAMDSSFFEPMRFGRLLLAGDAARRVPPAAAKGAGLAIADGEALGQALAAVLHRGNELALLVYSDVCQSRAWLSQEASTKLLNLVHVEHDDPFARRLQDVRLDRLRTSPVAAAEFAEHYVAPV